MHTARDITKALGGQWRGYYGEASCPVPGHGRGHGDQDPSLSIYDRDDGVWVCCFANCDWRDVKEELRRRGLLPERDGTPEKPAPRFESTLKPKREGDLPRRKAAQELWAQHAHDGRRRLIRLGDGVGFARSVGIAGRGKELSLASTSAQRKGSNGISHPVRAACRRAGESAAVYGSPS